MPSVQNASPSDYISFFRCYYYFHKLLWQFFTLGRVEGNLGSRIQWHVGRKVHEKSVSFIIQGRYLTILKSLNPPKVLQIQTTMGVLPIRRPFWLKYAAKGTNLTNTIPKNAYLTVLMAVKTDSACLPMFATVLTIIFEVMMTNVCPRAQYHAWMECVIPTACALVIRAIFWIPSGNFVSQFVMEAVVSIGIAPHLDDAPVFVDLKKTLKRENATPSARLIVWMVAVLVLVFVLVIQVIASKMMFVKRTVPGLFEYKKVFQLKYSDFRVFSCENGKCVINEVCSCDPGYTWDLKRNKCIPVCTRCSNGFCIAPGVCKCHEGYERIGESCQPICDG